MVDVVFGLEVLVHCHRLLQLFRGLRNWWLILYFQGLVADVVGELLVERGVEVLIRRLRPLQLCQGLRNSDITV